MDEFTPPEDYDHGQSPSYERFVTETYRTVVGELMNPDEEPRGVKAKVAVDEVVVRVRHAVEQGVINLPTEDVIRATANRVREQDGRATDAVLRRLRGGEDFLPTPSDPALRRLVVLGDGWTKQWRHITGDDLDEMDRIRYRNFRRAADAYDRWRSDYEWLRIKLRRYPTLLAVVEAQDLDAESGSED